MPSSRILKAVIPAAGQGTRFLPATKASPKEMIPLVDKPLIQYAVEETVAAGIHNIVLVTGRGKRAIEDHFDVSFELEQTLKDANKESLLKEIRRISDLASFSYVRQHHMRGLGDAVRCARPLIGHEAFAVLLGDEIIDADVPAIGQLMDLYQRFQAPVIGVQEVAPDEVSQYGIITAKPVAHGLFQITDLVEKPSPSEAPSRYAVIGRYVLTPEVFDALEKTTPGKNQEIQLTDALRTMAHHAPMYACVIQGKRYDAGDKFGYLKATVEFGLKHPEFGTRFAHYLKHLSL
jgi:UTP--glucose-1-phosphate uridylyltransferase